MNDDAGRGNVDCIDCDFSKQRNGRLMCDRCCDDDSGGNTKNDHDRCKWGLAKQAKEREEMTVLDKLAVLRNVSYLLCGFMTEVRMNQVTHDELIFRCGRVLPCTGTQALEGVRIVIDNDLPWNASEWVKRRGLTVISRERVPVFAPDPIRDLWRGGRW